MSTPPSWKDRQRRAKQLCDERPHAAEMLTFYVRLLELQEPLYDRARGARWVQTVTAGVDALPGLNLERLPLGELQPSFRDFLGHVSGIAPPALADIARSLATSARDAQVELLGSFLHGERPEDVASTFLARAFLQPTTQAIAEQSGPLPDGHSNTCPRCGWPPQMSALRDESETRGRRLLICSLCGSWWPTKRSLCPNCLETDTEKLIYHESDSIDYLRIEECLSCSYYVKSVDLRRNGNAVPDVEDVASVELDLWAQQRNLTKISRNVLGL